MGRGFLYILRELLEYVLLKFEIQWSCVLTNVQILRISESL